MNPHTSIVIDRDVCIWSGYCVADAPEIFEQDGDGIVCVRRDAPADVEVAILQRAVDACPVQAIRLAGDC